MHLRNRGFPLRCKWAERCQIARHEAVQGACPTARSRQAGREGSTSVIIDGEENKALAFRSPNIGTSAR